VATWDGGAAAESEDESRARALQLLESALALLRSPHTLNGANKDEVGRLIENAIVELS
jgi:hypothetical protein